MNKSIRVCLIPLLIWLAACQKDVPEPETKIEKLSFHQTIGKQAVFASSRIKNTNDPFIVRYHIKGNDVFVECRLRHVSFRKSDESKESGGKIMMTINGRNKSEINSAAFIIKNLESGTHRIDLHFVKYNGQSTTLKEQIIVTIP